MSSVKAGIPFCNPGYLGVYTHSWAGPGFYDPRRELVSDGVYFSSRKGGFAVKQKRFSVGQIEAVLKQMEVGVPVTELIRKVGVSEQTFWRWKKQYIVPEVDHVLQLKQNGA